MQEEFCARSHPIRNARKLGRRRPTGTPKYSFEAGIFRLKIDQRLPYPEYGMAAPPAWMV